MLEILGILVFAAAVGVALLFLWLLLLPFYLLFRLLGFTLKLAFGAVAALLLAVVVLPLVLLVGAVLVLKVLILGVPLLLIGLALWGLALLFRPAPA